MDKYKKLFSNTIVFSIGSFGSKILLLLMVKYFTNVLGTGNYGTGDLIQQAANILIPIASLSIADAIIRFGLDNEYDSSQVFTNSVAVALMGMTGLAIIFPLINLVHIFDGYSFILYVFVYISSFKNMCSQFVRSRGLVKL